jgi:ABC-type Co2+ transport system permease subunit
MACLAALIALAFRNSLWWIIGTNANAAGNGQFAGLLGLAVAAAFTAGLVIESVMRSHTERYVRS